jgi:hypothetical protein
MEPKDPKTYLWGNICKLMGSDNPSLDAVAKRAKIGRGTAQRIRDAQTSVGLDVLHNIAGEFDLEVWELLKPGLADPVPDAQFRQLAYAIVRDWDSDRSDATLRQKEFLAGFIASIEAELAKSAAMSALTVTKSHHHEGGEIGKYETNA